MAYRNANYAVFYVAEPFSPSGPGAFATPDFCHYQTLRMWRAQNASFPFVNAHDKTYDVRDGRVGSWARDLWNKLPAFRDGMHAVPTLHVPMEKDALREALSDPDFMVQSKCRPGTYRLA